MRLFAILVAVSLAATPAMAADHFVPTDFATIQAAITAAVSGDNVMVLPGTYPESINLKDGVNVMATDNKTNTTISGGVSATTVEADGVACTFSGFTVTGGNAPTTGGGMRIVNTSDVIVTDCAFVGNNSAGQGGGMSVQDSRASIAGCDFMSNTAGSGAALHAADANDGFFTITGCTFSGNTATGNGGALFMTTTDVDVSDSMFYGNSAASLGGAIALDQTTLDLSMCALYDNSALEGGAISFHNSSGGMVTMSTLYMNDASNAGGIACTNASNPSISQTIIAGSVSGPAMMCGQGSTPTVACSNLFGNLGGDTVCGTDMGNNISVDPEFCRVAPEVDGVFSLQSDSPCDAANNSCAAQIGMGTSECGVLAVEVSTWGRVKSAYR